MTDTTAKVAAALAEALKKTGAEIVEKTSASVLGVSVTYHCQTDGGYILYVFRQSPRPENRFAHGIGFSASAPDAAVQVNLSRSDACDLARRILHTYGESL